VVRANPAPITTRESAALLHGEASIAR